MEDSFVIAGREFGSRLIGGTGKFASGEVMRAALLSAEVELVTVALRRVDLDSSDADILDFLSGFLLLPNTAGAMDADEAVRLARLARAAELHDETGRTWVKLEVTPDPKYLLPDPIETLRAAEILCNEGFVVLPYMGADPLLARRLEEVGCATVMPLGSWIGSNQGLRTADAVSIIVEQSQVPVVVDAGIGAPSDAAKCMELGCSAVLVNTAIATAADPVAIGRAFKLAVEAGRQGYLAGLPEKLAAADASSPLTGFLA